MILKDTLVAGFVAIKYSVFAIKYLHRSCYIALLPKTTVLLSRGGVVGYQELFPFDVSRRALKLETKTNKIKLSTAKTQYHYITVRVE